MMQQKVKNNLHEVHNRKLSCEEFFNHLVQKKINFFTGVPDSLLKAFLLVQLRVLFFQH